MVSWGAQAVAAGYHYKASNHRYRPLPVGGYRIPFARTSGQAGELGLSPVGFDDSSPVDQEVEHAGSVFIDGLRWACRWRIHRVPVLSSSLLRPSSLVASTVLHI